MVDGNEYDAGGSVQTVILCWARFFKELVYKASYLEFIR